MMIHVPKKCVIGISKAQPPPLCARMMLGICFGQCPCALTMMIQATIKRSLLKVEGPRGKLGVQEDFSPNKLGKWVFLIMNFRFPIVLHIYKWGWQSFWGFPETKVT